MTVKVRVLGEIKYRVISWCGCPDCNGHLGDEQVLAVNRIVDVGAGDDAAEDVERVMLAKLGEPEEWEWVYGPHVEPVAECVRMSMMEVPQLFAVEGL